MTARILKALALVLLALTVAAPADAARPAKRNTAASQKGHAIDETVLKAQIMLARAGFSPGVLDGRNGDNLKKALRVFQQANGLPAGRLDEATTARLAEFSTDPALTDYTIQSQDTAGPFIPHLPHDFAKMAELPRLSYLSPQQLLAAKFRMSEALLTALNTGRDLAQPGTVITVANVGDAAANPVPMAAAAPAQPSEGSGSSAPPQTRPVRKETAAVVVVDKRERSVRVLDAENRLIAFYPASIGSREKPPPSGTLQVQTIAHNPDYTYNPAYAFKGQTAARPVRVAPGPNNPVGLVWIGLSLKGYGIHGAAEPEKVGKDQTHGCVRLTNWDALAFSRLVKKGTPVQFVG